ncbi:MAG TPA: ImmA/IrrE family metallo-endopeptidase [candidate division Zixibacteria bacterium]|jgi:Zn-dependent peptidase ImmA (M78 family)
MAKSTMGQERIENRVEKILKDLGLDTPPIPVDRVARALGATVRKEPYQGDLSGALYRREGLCVIGINKNENPLRQRFTIAHELGHLVLHDGAVYIDRQYTAGLSKPAETETGKKFFRDKVSSLANDPQEIEANRFAATLLDATESTLSGHGETEHPDADSESHRNKTAGVPLSCKP